MVVFFIKIRNLFYVSKKKKKNKFPYSILGQRRKILNEQYHKNNSRRRLRFWLYKLDINLLREDSNLAIEVGLTRALDLDFVC